MYIPIGPSKKQLYKIILLLLCLLLGFKSCVKAEEFNWVWSGMQTNGYNSNAVGWQENYSTLKGASNWRGSSFNSNIGSVQFYHGGGFTIPNTIKYGFLKGYFAFYNSEESVPSGVRLNSGNTRTTICSIDNVGDAFNTLYTDGTISKSTNGGIYSFSCYLLPGANYNNIEVVNSMGTANWSTYIYMKMSFDYYFSDNSQIVNNIQNNTQNINDSINSDNVDNNQANSFFNDFSSNTPQGLVSLINKPLDFLNGLYNTCSPITVYVPYFDFDLTLPCISSIDNGIFNTIIPIARIIINGLICYRLVLGFINIINKLKDPNDSDIEVVDL